MKQKNGLWALLDSNDTSVAGHTDQISGPTAYRRKYLRGEDNALHIFFIKKVEAEQVFWEKTASDENHSAALVSEQN